MPAVDTAYPTPWTASETAETFYLKPLFSLAVQTQHKIILGSCSLDLSPVSADLYSPATVAQEPPCPPLAARAESSAGCGENRRPWRSLLQFLQKVTPTILWLSWAPQVRGELWLQCVWDSAPWLGLPGSSAPGFEPWLSCSFQAPLLPRSDS